MTHLLFFLFFFFLPTIVLGEGGDVLVLTDSTFESVAKDHAIMLVKFYAPWCGHCKQLAPHYDAAATILKKSDPPVTLAKVDCTVETSICQTHGVSGYPTLKIFKRGQFAFDYEGARSTEGIVSYMESKAGPASREMSDIVSFNKLFTTNELSFYVLGCFSGASDAKFLTYMSVAEELMSDIKFLHSFNADVCEAEFKLSNGNIAIRTPKLLQNKFEGVFNYFKGSFEKGAVMGWVRVNLHGFAGVRSQDNMKTFTQRPLVILYFALDYVRNAKGTNYWRNRFMKVSEEVMSSNSDITVHFAVSNFDEMKDFEEFGFDKSDRNAVFVGAFKNDKNEKYKMEEVFSMDAYKKWLTAFLEGSLEPYIKSEAIPKINNGPVKVVVGKNFDEIVNDASKDVLIEFYAPWCGHCQQLEPKYTELGEKVAEVKDLVIAKMDATANDVPPQFSVTGFPTIYFVPKDNKAQPQLYQGEREVKGFLDFLKKKVPALNQIKTEL